MEERDFAWALRQLKNGKKVTRSGWNRRGMYLAVQFPDAQSANTMPYIFIQVCASDRVPWVASQTDLLGTDWEVVSE